MPAPVYGIFQGGGVKGIAHVGGIARLRSEYKFRFLAVAGTSAGAIVAALVAAGLTDEELKGVFDELSKAGSDGRGTVLTDLLEDFSWSAYLRSQADFSGVLVPSSSLPLIVLKLLWKLPCLLCKPHARGFIQRILQKRGLFRLDRVIEWLDEQLHRKLVQIFPEVRRPILFKDLQIPLKVVAAQVNKRGNKPGMVVFTPEDHPDLSVAQAVGASISVPFLFQPRSIRINCEVLECVDGGLVSNFPAWIFENERSKSGISVPTIGFQLVESQEFPSSTSVDDTMDLRDYCSSLVTMAISGDIDVHTRAVERLLNIPIETGFISFAKLDINRQEAHELWERGKNDAKTELSKELPSKEEETELRIDVEAELRGFCQDVWEKLIQKSENPQLDINEFRANVFQISDVGKAKIEYRFNMDAADHTDREFEFPLFGGSTGTAFARHAQVITPLYLAQQDQYMELRDTFNKIVEKLNIMNLPREIQDKAWQRLKMILSTPIFQPGNESMVLGVLNLDTSYTLNVVPLYDPEILELASDCARRIGRQLNRHRFRHLTAALAQVTT